LLRHYHIAANVKTLSLLCWVQRSIKAYWDRSENALCFYTWSNFCCFRNRSAESCYRKAVVSSIRNSFLKIFLKRFSFDVWTRVGF